jgi:uncharacterized LabA/DUF88 family protein
VAIIRHKEQRVGVFIDVQNLYYSAKHLYNHKVNFREILRTAVSGRKLIRSIAYVVRTKTGEEKPFFDALVASGIETKERELQEFYGGAKKADWDVGIVVDMIRLKEALDVIVLVSGDGDFTDVIEYLKYHGKQVEVMSFGKSTSRKIKESADDYFDLDQEPDKYLMKSRL